jgi:hypothetical protein
MRGERRRGIRIIICMGSCKYIPVELERGRMLMRGSYTVYGRKPARFR